jgi:predicted deacylase
MVNPGEQVEADQIMARLVDLSGRVVEDVRATEASVVVSWVDAAWVTAGGVLGTIGLPDSGPI